MDALPAALVAQIHASGRRLVLAVTGGGSGAIAALLRVPGGSRLLLEAVVPYAWEALVAFLGRPPEQACSPETAAAMAERARERAAQLAPEGREASLLGVGVTASLASDRPKRGDHRCHVAVASGDTVEVTSIVLEKGRRDRAAEEALVARAVVLLLARACGVAAPEVATILGPGDRLTGEVRAPSDPVRALLAGAVERLTALPDGRLARDAPRPAGVLPGSFNPLHDGHEELARVAGEILGGPVAFELSVLNVDKPPLTAEEVHRRVGQFRGRGTVELTRAPTFREKARRLPGVTFVVGVDTAARIIDPRYYGGSEADVRAALEEIGRAGCRFLVAGRADAGGRFVTLAALAVPPPFAPLFTQIPEARFRCDVSSTSLRAGR